MSHEKEYYRRRLQERFARNLEPLPSYSPTLGRWLFNRPQPKQPRNRPPKIGRWVLLALAAWAFAKLTGAL